MSSTHRRKLSLTSMAKGRPASMQSCAASARGPDEQTHPINLRPPLDLLNVAIDETAF
jgi:hypothetical protein